MTLALVLDTSELAADFFLADYYASRVAGFSGALACRLYIPQVSIDEASASYASSLEDARRRFDVVADRLAALDKAALPLDGRASRADFDYIESIVARLAEMGGKVLPYPDTSHQDVAGMMIGSPSADEQPLEYRDCLVWLSVVALIEETGFDIALFTGRSGMFSPGTGRDLRSDLSSMVGRLSIPASVKIFPDLSAFWNGYAENQLLSRGVVRHDYEAESWLNLLGETLVREHDLAHKIAVWADRRYPRCDVRMMGALSQLRIAKAIKPSEGEVDLTLTARCKLLLHSAPSREGLTSDGLLRCASDPARPETLEFEVRMVARAQSDSRMVRSVEIVGLHRAQSLMDS